MFTSVILVTSSSLWDSLYGITSDDVDVAYVHGWPNEPLDLIIDIPMAEEWNVDFITDYQS